MKSFIVLIVGLCFLGLTVAQSNCPGPDYSPILKLITSLNATIKPAKSVGYPEPLAYNNSRYANYWTYNYIAQSYADVVANASTYLIQALSNFSSAANNTKGDWSTVMSNISQALSLVSSGGSMPMSYCSMQFMNSSANMSMMFSNIQSIYMSYPTLLPPLNINSTPANIMKFIPSPVVMAAVLGQITNITNQYIALVNSTSKDVNNTFNLFKQADPYFLAMETQLNSTINNMTTATNNSIIFANQTLANFSKSANTTYNNFMNSLPTALKISVAWQNDWSSANSTRDMFMASLANMASSLNSYLSMYVMSNQMALSEFYSNAVLNQTNSIRANIFNLFLMNVSYNQCFSKFFNQSTAVFNASGAAPALFNCSNIESSTLAEIQTILTTYITTLGLDVNSTLAYMQRCTNLTNTPILSDGSVTYSVQQCLEMNSATIIQSLSIDSTIQQILTIISTELSMSSQRLQTCLSDNANQFMATYYPYYIGYQNCTMPPV